MNLSSMHGGPLRDASQELRYTAIDLPLEVLAAVTQLSGGYKHLESAFAERLSTDAGTEYRVSWIDDEVFGEVIATTSEVDWTGLEQVPNDLTVTGGLTRLSNMVSIAADPISVRQGYSSDVSVLSPLTLAFRGA